MSNLNTILNKLGKIEEIHETNLGKHEVDLALIDDIQKLQIKANQSEEKALAEYKKGIAILQNAAKLYLTARDNAILVTKEITKAQAMSNELGIKLPSNIVAIENYYGKSTGENYQMQAKINDFVNKAFN